MSDLQPVDTVTETDNAPNPSAIPAEELARMTDDIVAALKTVYDPEIPVDIYELGLVYKVDIDDDRNVAIDMTLTAPGCGMGATIAGDAQQKILMLPGVEDASVEIVWDPAWHQSMITPEGRRMLGIE